MLYGDCEISDNQNLCCSLKGLPSDIVKAHMQEKSDFFGIIIMKILIFEAPIYQITWKVIWITIQ